MKVWEKLHLNYQIIALEIYDDVLPLLNGKGFKDIKIDRKLMMKLRRLVPLLEQNYPEGYEAIPDETVLEFTVSKGPALIEVKNLTGYNATGVQDYAESVGLSADVSQKQFSNTVPEGLLFHKRLRPDRNRKRYENYGLYLKRTRRYSSKKSASGNYCSI